MHVHSTKCTMKKEEIQKHCTADIIQIKQDKVPYWSTYRMFMIGNTRRWDNVKSNLNLTGKNNRTWYYIQSCINLTQKTAGEIPNAFKYVTDIRDSIQENISRWDILLTSRSYDLLFLERKMTKTMLNNLFSTGKFKPPQETIFTKKTSNTGAYWPIESTDQHKI
jgi:hypothetical protein